MRTLPEQCKPRNGANTTPPRKAAYIIEGTHIEMKKPQDDSLGLYLKTVDKTVTISGTLTER